MNSITLCCLLFAVLTFSAQAAVANKINNVPLAPLANPDLSTVRYLLWTRTNQNDANYYLLDTNTLASSPFNDQLRTFFIIHGWSGSGLDSWVTEMKTNYLTVADCNVISVDWQSIAGNPNYDAAAQDMYEVGSLTASFIDNLVGMTALTTNMIHVAGHSLGGQMSGMIGKYITVGKLDRITAMDPAGPAFYNKPSTERIDKSDAVFVDVIHTNAGSPEDGCIGLFEAVGHVDFYPNGGHHQAGCGLPGPITGENWLDLFSGCSHGRSHDYYVESILAGHDAQYQDEFLAWPCSSYETYQSGGCPTCGQGCLTMGYYVDRSLTGSYYLTTHNNSPFAKGNKQ